MNTAVRSAEQESTVHNTRVVSPLAPSVATQERRWSGGRTVVVLIVLVVGTQQLAARVIDWWLGG